jgi:hypothetical protein
VHKRLLKLTLVASCVLALMLAGTAYAETPTGDTYGGLAGIAQGPSGGDNAEEPAVAAEAAADTSGELPFTGLQLGVFAVVGAGLLGTGLILRRTARSDQA